MIELTAPISGGKWNGMLDNEITWNSAFIADVKIEFSSDNAQSGEVLTDAHSAHYRSYTWEVPNVVSNECFIKISDVANPDVYSMNDEPFTFCSLDLLSPNGFEVFMVDLPMNVSWNSEFVGDLSILYKAEDGGDWTLIEEGVSADVASYEWIPEIPTGWCKIKVMETEYPDVADESEFRFFVYQLDLLSPQGGEDLEGFSEFNIEWEGEVIPDVKMEFSSDDGDTWEVIDANASVDESPYAWTVPNISSEDCFIKLSVPGAPELFKINPTHFAIHEAVGLNELNDHGLKVSVHPNPVKDFVNIILQKDCEKEAL